MVFEKDERGPSSIQTSGKKGKITVKGKPNEVLDQFLL
jgi:hypothetical protein